MTEVQHNQRAERAAAALLVHHGEQIVDRILDVVAPDDFADPTLRRVATAVSSLRSEGVACAPVVVAERIRANGDFDAGERVDLFLDALSADLPAAGAYLAVAKTVASHAQWRERAAAHHDALQACATQDSGTYSDSLRRLDETEYGGKSGGYLTPHDIASGLIDLLDQGEQVRYEWPLRRLNFLSHGGARRGQVTLIAGPSSHGKSAFVDMTLHSMAKSGAHAILFLNEMTAEERAERIAARLAHVKYSVIQEHSAGGERMRQEESNEIVSVMATQPVAMVPCAGWSVHDITREARRRKADVIAIDIVQKLPFESGRKRHETLEAAVQHVDAFAKDTGCHVILVGQLNRSRAQGTWPVPGMADVKDSAELVNGPDNVLFVWREQNEETLDPLDRGLIRMAKYRGCRLEAIPVEFQGEYQRFIENPYPPQEAAA